MESSRDTEPIISDDSNSAGIQPPDRKVSIPPGRSPNILAALSSTSLRTLRSPNKTKRKWLTLEEKISLIDDFVTHKLSTRKLAEKFGVGKTQVSNLLKDKDAVLQSWRENPMGSSAKKRMRKGSADVDALVYEWFREIQAQNIPVSGPLLQEKALEVAQALGFTDFKASNGWLCKFKARHGIHWRPSSGEPDASGGCEAMDLAGTSTPSDAAPGSSEAVHEPSEPLIPTSEVKTEEVPCVVDWRSVLKEWMSGYSESDVYNCVETPLLFDALPNRTAFQTGRKTAEQRLTILLCANLQGEFEEPLIIGNKLPAELQRLPLRDLGFSWKVNQYSWMTTETMQEWLDSFNLKMRVLKRNVILILEDMACHPHVDLSNVKLLFLPSHTRQPLKVNVLRCFKRRYRTRHLRHAISCMESSVSRLDAAFWTVSAIRDIKPLEVQKGFCEVGIYEANLEGVSYLDNKMELENLVRTVSGDLTAEEYVTADDPLPTSFSECDVQAVVETMKGDEEEMNLESEPAVVEIPVDHRTALESLKTVERFLLQEKSTLLFQKLLDIRFEIEKTFANNCLTENKIQLQC